MAGYGVQAVADFGRLLGEMLQRADETKSTHTVEPALVKSNLDDLLRRVNSVFPEFVTLEVKKRGQYAIIETTVRDTFNNLLTNTRIDAPEFVRLWNLLDIISILSDEEQCDPALLFWLVEELLDSQTVAGCRTIFDYLESRRDKITAKHFPQKQLVILRSCNELLRKLSRFEDTAFCGRVFIFLFQSFPLGDKSSVNLRGEFHTESVITFDDIPTESMDIDSTDKDVNSALKVSPVQTSSSKKNGSEALSIDQMYPIFWSLLQGLSQPKNLFDKDNFAQFKSGVESVKTMFESVQRQSRLPSSRSPNDKTRSPKRKRDDDDDDHAFNPKYLTSRDLFDAEISDLSFRRHVLVQIIIVLDFLISLGTDARAKLSEATLPPNPNKSVMYADYSFSKEDEDWAKQTRTEVLDFLMLGAEGPYFHRMIETVLARDKNWVRWKIENCPSISKQGITAGEYAAVKATARKATTNKRIRPTPLGSLDLKFLSESNAQAGLERLKDPSRYELPSIKSFKRKMELDDMDIEMAMDEKEKTAAIEAKSSKSWRALRIASATNLTAFDKIERSDKIDEIFLDKSEEPLASSQEINPDTTDVDVLRDRRPIIIAGPSGVGKSTLVKKLIHKHPKTITMKVSHTTRTPREGEVDGTHYNFISKEKHSMMRDADEFLEYNNYDGNDYGTSRKLVEGILAKGKVPVMEMEWHGIAQLKDNGFTARFIFIAPKSVSDLDERLRKRGDLTDKEIEGRLKIAQEEIDQSKIDGAYDTLITNDEIEETYEKLETYIFGNEAPAKDAPIVDIYMADGSAQDANGTIPAPEDAH